MDLDSQLYFQGLLLCLNRIMESLNLLRYLIIRDKVTENQVSVTAGVLIQSGKYQGAHPAKTKTSSDIE